LNDRSLNVMSVSMGERHCPVILGGPAMMLCSES
jgi:hypothetical protein